VLRRVSPSLGAAVIVVDNGSVDGTADVAAEAGAVVVSETRRGYGWACLAGANRACELGCDVLVFLDADGSMAPEDAALLLAPISAGDADLVLGARRVTSRAMAAHQRLANRLIGLLLRPHGVHVSELGPFRAVRASTWTSLAMRGSRFAWPAEMLLRAASAGARIREVSVDYAPRTAGRSKVGGSLRGTASATWEIGRLLLAGVRR
jgi:glycosyltransferase involved in cell wall biosynthesis